MAKEFVRNIKETKLRGKNIEPLYTNEQNDLLSDKEHAYIRNNDFYFPLTQAILDLASANDDGKNPVKPKLNIDGKENKVTLEWDTKTLGNNFVERTPITLTVDDEFNQIIIGIDQEALYRFIKPYFTSSKDITVDFDDKEQTISYRLDDQAFFERLASHFKDGNGLDFVIDNEFKTVQYNLKDDKIKSIIFDTVEAKDDDLAVEQQDGKLLIDLSDKNKQLFNTTINNVQTHTEIINRIEKKLGNADEFFEEYYEFILNLSYEIENILDKYHQKSVSKVKPEKLIEGIQENFVPEFYVLSPDYDDGKLLLNTKPDYTTNNTNKEKLLLIKFVGRTYVVNITKTDDVNNLTKEDVNKYNKELKNLKVIEVNDGYQAVFGDDENLRDIIYDLHTINSLEKI